MKKIFSIIILLVLIFSAAAVYFVYFNNIFGWFTKEQSSSAQYYSYLNSKYKFSLKYPKKWHSKESPNSDVVFFSNVEENIGKGGVPQGARVEVMILENSNKLSLDEWMREERTEKERELPIKSTQIKLAGEYAVREKYRAEDEPVKQGSPILIYSTKNDIVVRIKYLGREPDYSKNLAQFEKMVGSFSFSE